MKKITILSLLMLILSSACAGVGSRQQLNRLESYMNSLMNTPAKQSLMQQLGLPQSTQMIAGMEVWEYYKNNGVVNVSNFSSYQAGVMNNGLGTTTQIQHYEHLLCAFDSSETLKWWKYDYR